MADKFTLANVAARVKCVLLKPMMHRDAVDCIAESFQIVPGAVRCGSTDPLRYGLCSASLYPGEWSPEHAESSGLAHGEVKITGTRDSWIPIWVVPVGASEKELHHLSTLVQKFGRSRAKTLGTEDGFTAFVALRRDPGTDPILPANYTAEVIHY